MLRTPADGHLDPDSVLQLCGGHAGAGIWLSDLRGECLLQRHGADCEHLPAVWHVADPDHVPGDHVRG